MWRERLESWNCYKVWEICERRANLQPSKPIERPSSLLPQKLGLAYPVCGETERGHPQIPLIRVSPWPGNAKIFGHEVTRLECSFRISKEEICGGEVN